MIGFWSIEVTTPKIMKGNYLVATRIWGGASYAVYIDGVQTNIILASDNPNIDSKSTDKSVKLFKMGDVSWTTTRTHKIKVVALISCWLFYDRIEFLPE
jgi:hypothetical protein